MASLWLSWSYNGPSAGLGIFDTEQEQEQKTIPTGSMEKQPARKVNSQALAAPMTPSSDVRSEAVTFLGMLRHQEDVLTQRVRKQMKRDRIFVQDVFSSLVDEWTPLHACTLRGARKLVKMALKCGVPPDLQMGVPEGLPGRCSPLHLAAYRGDVSLVQLLAQNGASLDQRDSTYRTPLFYAVSNNNVLAARKLIKYGADVSDMTAEQKVYYKEDIDRRPGFLLCMPVPAHTTTSSR